MTGIPQAPWRGHGGTCSFSSVDEFHFVTLPPALLNSPLSPEKGKELMEGVAQLLEVPMSVFADVV